MYWEQKSKYVYEATFGELKLRLTGDEKDLTTWTFSLHPKDNLTRILVQNEIRINQQDVDSVTTEVNQVNVAYIVHMFVAVKAEEESKALVPTAMLAYTVEKR